jgi:hypothetical protein
MPLKLHRSTLSPPTTLGSQPPNTLFGITAVGLQEHPEHTHRPSAILVRARITHDVAPTQDSHSTQHTHTMWPP